MYCGVYDAGERVEEFPSDLATGLVIFDEQDMRTPRPAWVRVDALFPAVVADWVLPPYVRDVHVLICRRVGG